MKEMKQSQFNYILEDGNDTYWFNTLLLSFFRLSPELSHKIEDRLSASDFDSVPILDKLKDGGFVVDDDYDEISRVRELNDKSIQSKNYFLLILPTLNCNFSCHYCIQDHIPTIMTEETLNRVRRHLDYMIEVEKIESLRLDFFGGEPFMFFDKIVQPLAEYAREKCRKSGIPYSCGATTNGYYINKRVSRKLTDLCFEYFQITLDGDREHHNQVKFQKGCDSAFDYVLSNINTMMLDNTAVKLALRINYTHSNLSDKIVEQVNSHLCQDIRKRIVISPHKVWQEKVDHEFDIHPLLDLFKESGYHVSRWNPATDFIPCYASKKYYNAINYNGHVVKCTACDDLYATRPLGILGEDGKISFSDGIDISYQSKTFENERCLKCKALPICMGLCPRDMLSGSSRCKYECVDESIEKSILMHIKENFNGQ